MKQYLELCRHILENGTKKEDRTGTGTLSVFGYQMRFDLSEGFPLMTTKDMGGVRLKGIIEELLWFLRGETNIRSLVRNGVNIWNRDAYSQYLKKSKNTVFNENYSYKEFVDAIQNDMVFASIFGELGPIYGKQWRDWESNRGENIDQIKDVIKSIKENPDSRRHIVSAWNPSDVPSMALPPCHTLFQFYVADGKLSCQLYQRSGDVFLGIPYNIASYSLLLMLIARETGLEAGEFIHTIGDAHIYLNHIDQVKEQLSRKPHSLPKLTIDEKESVFDVTMQSMFDLNANAFTLHDYKKHPSIKADQSF